MFSAGRLHGFLAVARHLNFRRAAAELQISQPALSNQIKALEATLGVALFSRTTRRVQLTAEGERFSVRARRLLDEIDNAYGELREQVTLERGTVAFSCIPTIAATAFPRIIREFISHHPGVKVEMSDDTTASMERRILSGEVEFGVGGTPRSLDELDFAPIGEDPFVVVCRRDHPLVRRRPVAVRDLIKYPVISLSKGSNVRTMLSACFEREGLSFTPTYELIHHYSVGAIVEAGLGVTLLPSMACDMLKRSDDLRILPLDNRKFARAVGLIKRRGHLLSPAAHRFYLLVIKTMTEKAGNAKTKRRKLRKSR